MSPLGGGLNSELSSPLLTSCLIANNTSQVKGGAIYFWEADAEITNCTIAHNVGHDGYGGVYCDSRVERLPSIKNSILWDNGDDLWNCDGLVTYSCIEDFDLDPTNIHSDPLFVGSFYLSFDGGYNVGQEANSPCIDAGDGNSADLGLYDYTTTSDHARDSGTVDMGYHQERILPVPDYNLVCVAGADGWVDPNCPGPNGCSYEQHTVVEINATPVDANHRIIGWLEDGIGIFVSPGVLYTGNIHKVTMSQDVDVDVFFQERTQRTLTIIKGSDGGALLEPIRRTGTWDCRDGDVVRILTQPLEGYVTVWDGTDNDNIYTEENTVTIEGPPGDVTVSFRAPDFLLVPDEHATIQVALNAAMPGDTIVVEQGTYRPPQNVGAGMYSGGYDFHGRAVRLTSENPGDPCGVARTIIDCRNPFTGEPRSRAFTFFHGETRDSVVDGFTIIGGSAIHQPNAPPGLWGANGQHAYGGAIACFENPLHPGEGASPTIKNCIIKDCVAWGQDGNDGNFTHDDINDMELLEPLEPQEPRDPPDAWPPIPPKEQTMNPNTPVFGADGNDGIAGADGFDGLDGIDGANGVDGANGIWGGHGGSAYGGAIFADRYCGPLIQYCEIIGCRAIAGSGGVGGDGQNGQNGQAGQDGQAGQEGQDGQDGQAGGTGYEGIPAVDADGEDGMGGGGGGGGDGGDAGDGGDGGEGGEGGRGGDGGEGLGGAIFFYPDSTGIVIEDSIIRDCNTLAGIGAVAGNGGTGGDGSDGGD
ncbi:MAG: right-handed parallel beta-helix repeat-containing protein, partial [Planctomycetota bacterium]